MFTRNPLSKTQMRDAIYSAISKQVVVSKKTFNETWEMLEESGVIDRFLERKAKEKKPENEPERIVTEAKVSKPMKHVEKVHYEEVDYGLTNKTLDELEAMFSNDLKMNNKIALEMIKRPDFDRRLVVKHYNGLGVEIEMGSEGTYGKGIMLKRALTKQQFFTHYMVSEIIAKMLYIPQQARVYDPTCGSGRLFEYMPNHTMCHGVELEQNAYEIARALYPKAQILNDDTMLHIHEDEFDYVIGNPPFTLTFEDKAFLFKYAGFNNTMFSEVAVMEIAIRSVRDNGYISLVMPENVFLNKFQDKDIFMKYFMANLDPIAKIDLPKKTHAGTEYPVSLYIFRKAGSYQKYTANLPTFDFKHELHSFEEQDIKNLLAKWNETNAKHSALSQAENYIEVQEPYKLEPAIVKEWSSKDYLQSTSKIATNDIATLDLSKEIDIEMGFDPIPITVIPNGLHALMKTVNIAAHHPMRWNTAQKRYVDTFKEQMLVLDAFMNPKIEYDNVQLIKEYFNYDTAIDHTDRFAKGLERRKWFMEFQNTPFLQWIDEDNDGRWKTVFENEDFKTKYPQVYNQWVDRFNDLTQDQQYVTYLPFINAHDNWIAHLFDFQKEDAIRMAMKNSVMYCAQMGLGKTRTSIAAVLLKRRLHNLIICKANFMAEWIREFAELGLPEPHEVYYEDDIDGIEDHQFCIVTYETLKSKTRGKRPKTKHRSNPGEIVSNYDMKSPIDKENDLRNSAEVYGVSDDLDLLDLMEMNASPFRENPPKKTQKYKTEDELNKSEQKLAEMRKMYMFVDKLIGRFEVAIADECHVLANPTTYQSEAVRRLGVKEWLFLTGTPIKNRVHGLLSIIVMGWGENNFTNPYTKAEFLEHFKFEMEFTSTYIDSNGFKKTETKERDVPAINNPDDLRTLMAGKWLRRVHYEPDVTKQITFPIPDIRIRRIKPDQAEVDYAKQWYDEFVRLQGEIKDKKDEIKSLKDSLEAGGLSEFEREELEQKLKELRVLIALSPIIIGKLRFIALSPQIDPFAHTPDDSALLKWIHIKEPYKGIGLTPQQQELFDEIVTRVKKGEQCYTVCFNADFNYFFKEHLEAQGIRVKIVDGKLGTGDKKTQVINDFKEKKLDVLLTTIGCFSVGINIPHASYCGMIQPEWNWADMTQAYSRMIRPQSKGTRTVDFFILEDSIVEYVHQLFDMKRVNLEYVLDYHPKPPDEAFMSWQDMVQKMFADLEEGNFGAT